MSKQAPARRRPLSPHSCHQCRSGNFLDGLSSLVNVRGKHRSLFAELCDTLDLVPVLVPKWRMESVRRLVDDIPAPRHSTEVPRAFDELFIDLDDDETKEG